MELCQEAECRYQLLLQFHTLVGSEERCMREGERERQRESETEKGDKAGDRRSRELKIKTGAFFDDFTTILSNDF